MAYEEASRQVVSGEPKDVPAEKVDGWFKIDGIQLKDVCSVGESGLFHHLVPVRPLAFKGDNCCSGKNSKARLTLLLSGNADGSDKISNHRDVTEANVFLRR
ncbi:hypothetical protein AVEN_186701-1 [Araneus ventricosus]|uniref:Uncharacterized protein n=1 Tax=Araneus ventricosus TaxID=182803 RepID=A0A4Y2V1T4_ARAVE|nr:hypothetical protein AVEN_186701-1 [Araneus ventricosus]